MRWKRCLPYASVRSPNSLRSYMTAGPAKGHAGMAQLSSAAAKEVVAGEGMVLAPGIVDIHTHYDAQLTWDPTASPGYVFFVLRPRRVQAWREANEISGRTLMRDGRWLVD